MSHLEPLALNRAAKHRLTQVWRSAGWPCQDDLELSLIVQGLLAQQALPDGRLVVRLTPLGMVSLAAARQAASRALSDHDRLALRVAEHLMAAGRVVWRELSLRAQHEPPGPTPTVAEPEDPLARRAGVACQLTADLGVAASLPQPLPLPFDLPPAPPKVRKAWRVARPDVFSIRKTSVPAYLHPVVHEVKVSRADLLSDLRHAAKRQSYQWLCSECIYVFPAGLAEPEELPDALGVMVVHGDINTGMLELLRPARHQPCQLPFDVWMALAKATPESSSAEAAQGKLAEDDTP